MASTRRKKRLVDAPNVGQIMLSSWRPLSCVGWGWTILMAETFGTKKRVQIFHHWELLGCPVGFPVISFFQYNNKAPGEKKNLM